MADDKVPDRSGDYRRARIAAGTVLTLVVAFVVVVGSITPTKPDPVTLVALLGAIAGLFGVEVIDAVRKR